MSDVVEVFKVSGVTATLEADDHDCEFQIRGKDGKVKASVTQEDVHTATETAGEILNGNENPLSLMMGGAKPEVSNPLDGLDPSFLAQAKARGLVGVDQNGEPFIADPIGFQAFREDFALSQNGGGLSEALSGLANSKPGEASMEDVETPTARGQSEEVFESFGIL